MPITRKQKLLIFYLLFTLIGIYKIAASNHTIEPLILIVSAQSTTSTDSSSTDKGGTIPIIPKPELLPGPPEEANQNAVQTYFRDNAVAGFIQGFLGLVAGLSLMGLLVSGIRFIVAYGEEEGITAAKKTATWSVVGFVITLLALAIVSIINTLAFPKSDIVNQTGEYTKDAQENIQYENI
ncbi:MAG: hypothetical protein UT55_C0068G0002 [Candidatus Peregrinibacteria bacterium GW2011_GWE2_39_6]|nr:MAG: hypothetical protein UT36_C0006G0044 [Candidatus Peregrinibacteria bacterium GW2011_GWF2_39_17]KKR24221.1 MAG: hypothetical protein UT55_C0068G0002 [Candidatus Peregrinibacteria bacterium GW2011_GWE2_39_6]HCW32794.1 hypothetical protein [Candidatus Peregrinibacteria bacterium]